jgi:hypothetical protein
MAPDSGTGYSARVAFRVIATGVLIRSATGEEVLAVEAARHGREFHLDGPRNWSVDIEPAPPAADEALVVGQAFVDFEDDGTRHRWVAAEHHGHVVSLVRDATLDLLQLAKWAAEEGLIELLSDMGIAGLGVSRWALVSAPHRIELAPELEARLAPLRRR